MDRFIIVLLYAGLITGCTMPADNTVEMLYAEKVIETGKRIYDRGLTFGTGGDLSVRIPETDSIIIKATGTSLGFLDRSKLVLMNIDGSIKTGEPKPSHETTIHCAIYRMRQEVGAIMHMHAPYATAWATVGKKIPVVTQQSANILKGMAVVPYYKVGSEKFNNSVITAYKDPEIQVVLLSNHGVFVIGKDLEELYFKADVVENTARIAYLSLNMGKLILPRF